jgi:hypothetical protein
MKYVFVIHSHTVFLSSIGTINHLKLHDDDVRFIYARNYKNSIYPSPYKSIDLSKEHDACNYSIFHYKIYKNLIKTIDSYIADFVNDNFTVFVPHSMYYFFQIILSNKKCVDIQFIQEGAMVLDKLLDCRFNIKSFKYLICNLLLYPFYKYRIWATYGWIIPFYVRKGIRVECYALSLTVFEKSPYKTHIIKWPQIELKTHINPQYPCFVFDSSIEIGAIEKNIYIEGFRNLIKNKSEESNYIKFHPRQSEENKKIIKDVFLDLEKNVIELPMDVPFEIYISQYKNIRIYGFNSSLLIFSAQLGHDVFSLESELTAKSGKYSKWKKNL